MRLLVTGYLPRLERLQWIGEKILMAVKSRKLQSMRESDLHRYAQVAQASPRQAMERGYFDPRTIRRLCDRSRQGQELGHEIWMLLALELWHREFVDQSVPVKVP